MTDPETSQVAAVLGAGLLGAAIAAEYAKAGFRVRITASERTSPEAAIRRVRNHIGADTGEVDWYPSTSEAAAGATVVVESLPEDLSFKQRELREAQRSCPDAVLCSNTSSLSITELAKALDDPSRLIGTHYLNPPAAFRVVELVPGPQTAPEIYKYADDLLRRMGKTPVLLRRDEPGFVVNRLQFALLREAVNLVDSGVVSPEDLDVVIRDGLARRWSKAGPFAVVEMGGPPVFEKVAAQVWPHLSNATTPSAGVSRTEFEPKDLEALRMAVRQALTDELSGPPSA